MTNPLTLLRTRLSLLIGLCLVFVALSDNVLYGQTLGINLPLAGAALLLLLAVRVFRRVRPLPQVAAVLAIVGLLAAQAYRTSLPAALLTGVGLITLALGVRHGWTADVETWAQRWMRFLPAACLQPFRDQAFASRWRSRHPRFVQISRMMVMRFCLPLALGALFIGLFALAMAYPYLPGAQTEAFKGLSVLLGLMISLGASSIIGQGAAGLILTYSRTIKIGEYIRIGDQEGTVTEMGMFTTRIRTGLGEELTLPNSLITSSVTKNYSREVKGRGYILDTVVTIGYDTPWR